MTLQPKMHPPSAPVIATAKSVRTAHNQIRRHIESEDLCTLRLAIPKTVLQSHEIATILPKIANRGYVVTYFRISSVLSIVVMPTAIHGVIMSFIHYSMTKWLQSGFLTAEEYKHIQLMPPDRIQHQSGVRTRKRVSWKKASNCSIGFGLLGQKLINRVAIEVGFSEAYEDLVDDVCGWLQRSSKLSIAILINIKEDLRTLHSTQSSEDFGARASVLLDLGEFVRTGETCRLRARTF